MPAELSGKLREFTEAEIDAMEIETIGVRDFSHPVETREVDQSTMSRPYLVKWDQRYYVLELVLGRVALWSDGGTPTLSRLLPHIDYGRHHTNNNIIATKCEEMVGFGQCEGEDDRGMPMYPRAKLRFLFENVPFALSADNVVGDEFERYVIPPREDESDAEYTTMPGGVMNYITADASPPQGVPIPFNVGIVTPTQRMSWEWIRLPRVAVDPGSPLHDRIFRGETTDAGGAYSRPYIGTVNKVAFEGHPAGTLLFEGVRRKLKRDQYAGEWVYDVLFKFNFRPQGWLRLPYFAADGTGAANGPHFIGKGATYYTAATLPDYYSLFDARDHYNLFKVS